MLLDQTDDLVWAVDHNLYLVYANKAYLNLMKEVTGVEKELNTDALIEGFGEGYIEKWTAYYKRALSGEFLKLRNISIIRTPMNSNTATLLSLPYEKILMKYLP